MNEDLENLKEFSKQIKSGELYENLQSKLLTYQKKKSGRKDKSIESFQKKIESKEIEIQKLIGEIIHLQNQLSSLLDKELNS
ncbi:hypothetical protein [Leptospira ilyithenensis]|uniref:Uncharacterized protein n=1 Tax=Leptospira ilyithenensis TaxID=2484901 RepID=A0A4R9LPD3_9LEPT|nr:hypothetical protein [Leptospira ilyithenensis]TGN10944.1 hypothetical protein EHS11_07125 [Leptospira ilyithenensis]